MSALNSSPAVTRDLQPNSEVVPRFRDIAEPRMVCLYTGNGSGTKLFQGFLDDHPQLDPAVRMRLLQGVVAGVAKLHSLEPKPLIHSDIKPENVLVSSTNTAKVADFGQAAGGVASVLWDVVRRLRLRVLPKV